LPEAEDVEEILVSLNVSAVTTAGTLNTKVEVFNPYSQQWYEHVDASFTQVTSSTGAQHKRLKTYGMLTRVTVTIAGTGPASYTCQVVVNAKTFESRGRSWSYMGLIPKARRTSTYTSGKIDLSNYGVLGLFLEVSAINTTGTLDVKVEDVLEHISNMAVSNYAFSTVTSSTCLKFKPVDCQGFLIKATGTIASSGDYTFGLYGLAR